ncbi:hypothetical protein [Roseococcus sp. YIM B11640]|uniref:hypothetical protein n=1 Tax=Roseococcus sp. YIM B11640 TaxID=3133973 RepID=UPI003C79E4AD
MRVLDFVKVLLRAGDPGAKDFRARLLRGDVLGSVDTAGGALGEAAGPTFRDADATGKEEQAPLAAVLVRPFSDSGLGGMRHVRGQL